METLYFFGFLIAYRGHHATLLKVFYSTTVNKENDWSPGIHSPLWIRMQFWLTCWFLSKNAVGSAQLLSSNKLRFRNTFGNCLLRAYSYLLDLFITHELLCDHSLNKRLYCTEWAQLHLLFCQPLHGLNSSIMGCVPIFHNCEDWKVHSVVHA